MSALAAMTALASHHAGAMNLFAPIVSNSGVIDGGSIELAGTIHDPALNARPWVGQLYAGIGECLRLEITTTSFDSEITVLSPNGTVYRDDDGNGALRPLVKIANAPASGWYTVQVAQFNGFPVNQPFHMLYGRYLHGNINCAGETLPMVRDGLAGQDVKDTSANAEAGPKDASAP